MYKQNEVNNATKPQWTAIGGIDPSHIDTTYLPEVVVTMGERNLVELLNSRLSSPRFEVKFDFDKVKRTLSEGEFNDIALFYHDLTIPKSARVLATIEAIEEVFDVEQVSEGDETVTFRVYLGEGPMADTVEEIVYGINQTLGPTVEKNVKQLGLHDYHMTFNISLGY